MRQPIVPALQSQPAELRTPRLATNVFPPVPTDDYTGGVRSGQLALTIGGPPLDEDACYDKDNTFWLFVFSLNGGAP